MNFKTVIPAFLIAAVIFGTIILYVFQFQLLSSLTDYPEFYSSSIITFLLLFIVYYFLTSKVNIIKNPLERMQALIAGGILILGISPLILIMINKLSIDCNTHSAEAIEVKSLAGKRFGIVEGEKFEADYIDVYFMNEDSEKMKIRKYKPIPSIIKGQSFNYEKCTGLTGLQWMRLQYSNAKN